MKTVREQFEEIWPVPEGVEWNNESGEYEGDPYYQPEVIAAAEHNARLDTFTHCQESQAIVTSLNDELVEALDLIAGMHDFEASTGSLAMSMYEASCIAKSLVAKAKGPQS
jgi:hypothetical protein